jgi:hypothetical protein
MVAGLLIAVVAIVAGCMGQRAANLEPDRETLAAADSEPVSMPEVVVNALRTGTESDAAEPFVMPEVLVTAPRSPASTQPTADQTSGVGTNLN